MQYISIKETSKKFGISERRVQKLCEEGRIAGSQMISNVWIIPNNAKKPLDERYTSTPHDSGLVSLKELSTLLSISEATGRNWLKLGKIVPSDFFKGKPMFTQEYIKSLKKEITSGKNTALKGRRNKKYVSGSALYKDYVSDNSKNLSSVEQVLSYIMENDVTIGEKELHLITAECALQLMSQKYDLSVQEKSGLLQDYLSHKFSVPKYNRLILDLIGDFSGGIYFVEQHSELFNVKYIYEEAEDILGLLYISCRNLSTRKATGAYYTPTKIVKTLIADLFPANEKIVEKSVIDPCCGTGNFLLQLPSDFSIDKIFGIDIDETSILLTRINCALKFYNCNVEVLYSNITLQDYFKYETNRFDYILGNPPWGFDYSDLEKELFRDKYKTAKGKVVESYDLFVERSLSKLETGGYLAFVLPEAILNVKVHQPVREEIISNGRIVSLQYLGNAFDGVQCPCIILRVMKDMTDFSTKGMQVKLKDNSFTINTERTVSPECFSFTMTDEEYSVFSKIEKAKNCVYLKNNADFALGIVTGNNKQYISTAASSKNELVLKGSEIYKYRIKPTGNYIVFEPENFQQVAPIELYRAPEKLLYRFICSQLVFVYDNEQALSLNSCNIVIPKLHGLNMKYVMAILNSRVAQFYFAKQFQSVKVLRSHIEQIPIPVLNGTQQNHIIEMVDCIEQENDETHIIKLYNELDKEIALQFEIDEAKYATILNALGDNNLFLF